MDAPRHTDPGHVLACAKKDHDSVLELTQTLVRVPSRGGIDPYEPVIHALVAWMDTHGLTADVLHDTTGAAVAVTADIRGAHPGPRYVLNACLDTAPFGDEAAWTHPPTSGLIEDGWLWGRGSSDSKVAVAVFCHLAARFASLADRLRGTLTLLFDLDEHTGGFGGAKRYFEGPDAPDDVAGVLIGYPGTDKLVIGGRGVHRAQLHVHGVASHSGGRKTTPGAIDKAAHLVHELRTAELPTATADFPVPGKLTVTAINAGQGYSVTPDLCTLNIDIRTTPAFDDTAAAELLATSTAHVDQAWPNTPPTRVHTHTRWPPYALPPDSLLRSALLDAARAHHQHPQPKIAGPSNIGNYLAGLGIPATAGFGVDYTGLHATDERFRTDTVPTVQATYHTALATLLLS
ncbi:M20/M25/M40 family metallo-hydrolase [Streptomyces sp. DSM 44915]|uniref:M20/M25/M40 family metallo-hydrolase n=1 Tax=Streptomyces chisholmiae TaxID=3075540 RepID=A0ABU2JRM9_9ACTN|nr:M20/M25/M40 family metallo-hydrolase [Streptomyces sp. DSM 44915]MDT0267640.1 M20/M25/M40 family metallo-hydrolase [Streptomyces sp. DSM 44915]